jgi:hypothetical protein
MPQRVVAMRKRLPVLLGYLVLFTLSLGIPWLHYSQTNRAIEAMRPAMKLNDGSYVPMLLPVPVLFLRDLGQSSVGVPIVIFSAFVLSFWWRFLARPMTLCLIAICQCGFTTAYALYATWVMGIGYLHGAL